MSLTAVNSRRKDWALQADGVITMGGVVETVAAILLAIGAVGFGGFKAIKAVQDGRSGVALAWVLVTPLLVVLAWVLAFAALMILGLILLAAVVWLVLSVIKRRRAASVAGSRKPIR